MADKTFRDLGPVTAYAAAVEKGYFTGTEEEWLTMLSNVSEYASQAQESAGEAADSAAAAEESAETFTTDPTLTQSGKAADAKATGDAINAIGTGGGQETKQLNDESFWAQGYWAVANGGIVTATGWTRSWTAIDNTILSMKCTDDLKLFVVAYDDSAYIGTWMGSGFTKTYDASYVSHEINFTEFRENYPTYAFRVDVTRIGSGGGPLLPSETAQKVTITISTSTVSQNERQIVFGNFAQPKFWQNGAINSSGTDPTAEDGSFYKRLNTINKMRFLVPVTVTPNSGYTISVNQYALDGTFETQFSSWSENSYTFSDVNKLYRVVVKAANNSALQVSAIGTYITTMIAEQVPNDRVIADFANVKTVNHRGYNTEAPENTLPAYLLSARYGFKFVETDVLFTSDGVPVLMHDDTINRTCCNAANGSSISGSVSIESVTYADLIANYDACTPAQWSKWAGVKVPTFEEFMRYCRALNLHPWIELKWTHTYTQAEVNLIISIVKKYGMENHVSFISFSYDALALVKDVWDSVELGLNGTVADAQLLKTGKNRVFMIFNYTGAPSSYADAISAGFELCFYTVNTESALSGINTYAYDSILTNTLLPSQVDKVIKAKSVE